MERGTDRSIVRRNVSQRKRLEQEEQYRMGHKKNLLCVCGDSLVIDSTQAGSMLPCHCGEQIQVPTLREIAQLPDAEPSSKKSSSYPRRWTRTQGILFAIGAACLLAAGITATVLFNRLPKSELPGSAGRVAALDRQLDSLTPQQTLELWQFYKAAPSMMVGIKQKMGTLEKRRVRYTMIGCIVGGGGLVTGCALIIFSLRWGKPKSTA